MRKVSAALLLTFMLSVSLFVGVVEASRGQNGGTWYNTFTTCTTSAGAAGTLWENSNTGTLKCRAL
jgi:hypothetical protein